MDRFGEKVNCNPKTTINKNEVISLIPMEDINPIYKYVKGSEEAIYEGQGGTKFQDGDIIMARITPCLENGKISIASTGNKKGVGSTEYFVFRGISGVTDTDYIYYLLGTSYFRQLAVNSMTGASGRQRADIGFIKRIKWKFPSLEEQKRIAGMLSPYDDLVLVNDARIESLMAMANELYREWFARRRFPGYEKVAFKEDIPENWEYKRIGDLCSFVSRGITPSYVDDGIKLLNQKCIRDGRVSFEPCKMTDAEKNYSAEKYLKFGDTVINSTGTGTLGRTAIYYYEDDIASVDGHVSIVRTDDELYSFIVGFYLRNVEPLIENLGKGSTNQIELSASDIKRIKMLLPNDKGLIGEFNEIVKNIFQQIRILENKNVLLIQQRNDVATRLLMPKE